MAELYSRIALLHIAVLYRVFVRADGRKNLSDMRKGKSNVICLCVKPTFPLTPVPVSARCSTLGLEALLVST
jgi:hypothetical protein